MPASVRTELWEVVSRLNELGLKVGLLQDAVRRGYVASASCTENHPPLVRGILGWGEVVCALREYLIPLNWSASDESNYSVVINPTGRIAIAVATGDEGTGNPKAFPSTKSLKGPNTAAAVTLNQQQLTLDLFDNTARLRVAEPRPEPAEGRKTYLLLVYRGENELRCELSLPDQITEEGRVNGWSERIILDPISLDGEPLELTPSPQPDLDIDVKRRTS